MNNQNLECVWEVNEPYPEVLSGVLNEDVFAASLSKVRDKKAESIYQDPKEFFAKTYLTDALTFLTRTITEKLNGSHPELNPVYKLETSFGGGKTHSLIALYHTFKNAPVDSANFSEIINGLELPSDVKVVCLDCDEYNPQLGDKKSIDVTVRTLWGDLAYQLGGKEAYEKIRKNDEKLTSPGSKTIEEIMGDTPVLILIDEPAAYFSRADSVLVGRTTLTQQSVTFIFDLLSAVSKKPNAVVVLTLASSKDAFAEYTAQVNNALLQAESIVARKAQIIYPTKEDEIYGVVRRRLFNEWNTEIGKKIANAYYNLYKDTQEVSSKFKSQKYLKKLEDSYPFHPELIDILETRIASFSTFQRTRGVLRLLAYVIADMWKKKEKDAHFISPAFVSLSNSFIRNELTGKLKKGEFIPAIKADIANEQKDAKSQIMDKEYIEKGLPPLVSRVSNSVYLYSLIIGKEKIGIDEQTVNSSVLTPSIKYSTFQAILDRMYDTFWYYRKPNERCFFLSEPNINKIIQEYMAIVKTTAISSRINQILNVKFKESFMTFFKTTVYPSGPSDVPDDDNLKLIILNHKTTNIDTREEIPEIVLSIWNYGKDNRPREYKNTTYFVVAAKNQVQKLNAVTREFEAIQIMEQNKEDFMNISKDQKDKFEDKKKQVRNDLENAVLNAYKYLYYPRGNGIESAELNPLALGDKKKTRQEIIGDLLVSEGKIKKIIKSAYAKSRAWPSSKKELTTLQFKNLFYERSNLPIPLNLETVKQMIRDGVKNRIWLYISEEHVYNSNDKIAKTRLIKDDKVILLEEAVKRNLCNEDGLRCTKCDKWPCECQVATALETEKKKEVEEKDEVQKQERYSFVSAKGLPQIIIQNFEEDYEQKNPVFITELKLICDNNIAAKSLITLLVHIPENSYLDIEFNIERTDLTPHSLKRVSIQFSGNPDDFREFFNGIFNFIENKKLKPELVLTIGFDKKKKKILDNFFDNLKNYNALEYQIEIEGIINL